ncbi:hypothetical protein ACWERV_23115 [Streptomyces sp. NPDC004031]
MPEEPGDGSGVRAVTALVVPRPARVLAAAGVLQERVGEQPGEFGVPPRQRIRTAAERGEEVAPASRQAFLLGVEVRAHAQLIDPHLVLHGAAWRELPPAS